MQGNSFDELPPAFQRYAHDEYLGGEDFKKHGISRAEREMMYGQSELRRTLKCGPKIKVRLITENICGGENLSRTFEFVEPGPDDKPVVIRKTEEEILNEYYPHWFQQMAKKVSDRTQITREGCLEDWCTCHWATEVKE